VFYHFLLVERETIDKFMMYMISEKLVPRTNTDPWPEQYRTPQVPKGAHCHHSALCAKNPAGCSSKVPGL